METKKYDYKQTFTTKDFNLNSKEEIKLFVSYLNNCPVDGLLRDFSKYRIEEYGKQDMVCTWVDFSETTEEDVIITCYYSCIGGQLRINIAKGSYSLKPILRSLPSLVDLDDTTLEVIDPKIAPMLYEDENKRIAIGVSGCYLVLDGTIKPNHDVFISTIYDHFRTYRVTDIPERHDYFSSVKNPIRIYFDADESDFIHNKETGLIYIPNRTWVGVLLSEYNIDRDEQQYNLEFGDDIIHKRYLNGELKIGRTVTVGGQLVGIILEEVK